MLSIQPLIGLPLAYRNVLWGDYE